MPVKSNRAFSVTPADDGQILELGPAGSGQQVATFAIQINPNLGWNGQVVVVGRAFGKAAADVSVPWLQQPYRRVNLNNVPQDRAVVSDPIDGVAQIEVPSNGWSIGLLVTCVSGAADVVSWPLNGPSS